MASNQTSQVSTTRIQRPLTDDAMTSVQAAFDGQPQPPESATPKDPPCAVEDAASQSQFIVKRRRLLTGKLTPAGSATTTITQATLIGGASPRPIQRDAIATAKLPAAKGSSSDLPVTPLSALVDMLEDSTSTLIDYLCLVGGLAAAHVGKDDYEKLASTFAVLLQVASSGSGALESARPGAKASANASATADATDTAEGEVDLVEGKKRTWSQATEGRGAQTGARFEEPTPKFTSTTDARQASAADASYQRIQSSHHKDVTQTSSSAPPPKPADPRLPRNERAHRQRKPTVRGASADPAGKKPAGAARRHNPAPPASGHVTWPVPPGGAMYMPCDVPISSFHIPPPSDAGTATPTNPIPAWIAALHTVESTRQLSLTTAAIEASKMAGAQAASGVVVKREDIADAGASKTQSRRSTIRVHEEALAAASWPTGLRPIFPKPSTLPTAAGIPGFPYLHAGLGTEPVPALRSNAPLHPHTQAAPPFSSAAHHLATGPLTSFANPLARPPAVASTKAFHTEEAGSSANRLPTPPARSLSIAPRPPPPAPSISQPTRAQPAKHLHSKPLAPLAPAPAQPAANQIALARKW
ncbi:hypothetical protein BCR44DRAFT_38099 [Catenaria anguillulae PL171]|uniref:Uncharacterized protein n=1 Tax=Catenaria anguillulae PL171 TaxID=765915 RepID=A0A1Y2I4R9_9FUNG|nr:hypothetical protein BCR44DRAFT_38099 [Catenaria anguillulae PL171]